MTPLKTKAGEKVLTPVRRSVRNLPDNPKESSGLCLIFPAENKKIPPALDPKSSQKDRIVEEVPNSESVQEEVKEIKNNEPVPVPLSLRRSTRKTPSKYKSSNFIQGDKVYLVS